MSHFKQMVDAFLDKKYIAVIGLSRTKESVAEAIYKKLQTAGYTVYAIHPHSENIKGIACYPDLAQAPQQVEAVFAVVKPEKGSEIVKRCAGLGIKLLWLHRGFGSSVSKEAVETGRQKGVTVIAGGCPMMFCEPVDPFHRFLRWWHDKTGKLPDERTAH